MAANNSPVILTLVVNPDIAAELLKAVQDRRKYQKQFLKLHGGIGKAAKSENPREKLVLELEKIEKYLADQL